MFTIEVSVWEITIENILQRVLSDFLVYVVFKDQR